MRFVITILAVATSSQQLAAQVMYEGCTDINGVPVATVTDFSLLGDIAQATIASGAPIIRFNPQSVIPGTPLVVLSWFYLHECAHHASGQVLAMLAGRTPYTMAIEIQADCMATQALQQRAGPFGPQAKLTVQQFLVALNNAGDAQHPPSSQRAQLISTC
jgi:hypothetical protein